MNFGLEDKMNNTILGTPIADLEEKRLELMLSIQRQFEQENKNEIDLIAKCVNHRLENFAKDKCLKYEDVVSEFICAFGDLTQTLEPFPSLDEFYPERVKYIKAMEEYLENLKKGNDITYG